MTLAIRVLKNVFPLHTETQDCHLMYHLTYRFKYHNVDIFSINLFSYVDEWTHFSN
jgi:hypothetical protein